MDLIHDTAEYSEREVHMFTVSDRQCSCIILWPTDTNNEQELILTAECTARGTETGFILAAYEIHDWNSELSPWTAAAVFGDVPFTGGADVLLDELAGLVGFIKVRYNLGDDTHVILGGYSLAGLFALYCGYKCGMFSGIAAVSPSVWFEGWDEFTSGCRPKCAAVYLSLGNKEEKARNPRLRTVGDCIRRQYERLESDVTCCILEWNEGNHFCDAAVRTAKGFIWCINKLK